MLSGFGSSFPALCQETLAQYISKVMSIPDLSKEDELHFAKMYVHEKSLEAAHQLVFSHLKYVVKISRKFLGYGLPMSELIAEGNTGLLRAVKNFNYTMGFRFVTYASWWIKAYLKEYVFRFNSFVSISNTKSARKLFFGFRKLKKKLLKMDDRPLNADEIAYVSETMQVSKSDVLAMEGYFFNKELSLNSKVTQDHTVELQDNVPSSFDAYKNHDELSEHSQKMELLHEALHYIPERLADIITKRHLTDPPHTLEFLSKIYNLSKERIRQLEMQAMEKIRSFIRSKERAELG